MHYMNKISKTYSLYLALAVMIFIINIATTEAQTAAAILEKVEEKINSISTLQYFSKFTKEKPLRDNPSFSLEANIYLQKIPTDSIFHSYFHIQGEDNLGPYNYFYQGKESYELRPEKKQIYTFQPHQDSKSKGQKISAKLRTSYIPFVEWVIDDELVNNITSKCTKVELLEEKNDNKWIINITYKPNEADQKVKRKLFIRKEDYVITKIIRIVNSPVGTKSIYKFGLSDIRINDTATYSILTPEYSFEGFSNPKSKQSSEDSRVTESIISGNAPEFAFPTFSEKTLSFDNLEGKWILLDFWESWCGNCRKAIPEIEKIHKQSGEDFRVIGVVKDNYLEVEAIIDKAGISYTNLKADQTMIDEYKVTARPTYILINPEGKIESVAHKIPDKVYSLIE